MKVLVTGAAGFIGFHLSRALLERGDEVIGIDNLNNYYDVKLKYARLGETGIAQQEISYGTAVKSSKYPNYKFIETDITDEVKLKKIFRNGAFDVVCNLAAQAGVRYSLTHPKAYVESNITGFLHILECCRLHRIKHLVYASSSSVYGLNEKMPFSAAHHTDHPVSLYAASKKSNELMAHAYSHLYKLPVTGLRFFTVYGPWGRPDMALHLFTRAILEHKPLNIYNNGRMKRDFTYIDDIIDGMVRVIDQPAGADPDWKGAEPDPSASSAPYRIFNIGRGQSVSLIDFITEIEKHTGNKAIKKYLPMQNGDVTDTWADISDIRKMLGYNPKISVPEGVMNFVEWYKRFYVNHQPLLHHKSVQYKKTAAHENLAPARRMRLR